MGCGCLLALGSLALPRVTIVFLQLFTERMAEAMPSFVVGFLGFALLPYTTVFYALAYQPAFDIGVTGFGWFVVGVGFLLDLGALFGGGRESRKRYSAQAA